MKQIPNLFTLLNLIFGCLAIVFAMQSGLAPMYTDSGLMLTDEAGAQFINLPEKIVWASFFIMMAAVVDFLDGFVARLLKATSEMGKQLDSLSDVVSFGVAPAMIIYQFLRLCFAQQDDGLDTNISWLLPAFILPCAGAWRLARFNIDTEQNFVFKGLPIPAAGLFIASLPLIYWFSDTSWQINFLLNKWTWYGLTLLLSWLMVSKLPLQSLKFKDFSLKNNISKLVILVTAAVTSFLFQWLAIPVTIATYIIISLLLKNKTT
jgi:CDP-diacylglycerol--serine O-phosphatidyltransferase